MKINHNEISNIVDEYLKYIKIKRDGYKLEFENGEKNYRKINNRELDEILDKKLGDLENSKELQKINKVDLLVSYDFDSFYPSAQVDINSTWPKIETSCPFENYMSDAVCTLLTAVDGMN